MTGEQYLHLQSSIASGPAGDMLCPHGDTCRTCRERRMWAEVAQEMWEEGAFVGPLDEVVREHWDRFRERLRKMPSLN